MVTQKRQDGFGVVEIVLVILLLGLAGVIGWLVWSKNSTTQSATSQTKSIEIPEIGVKIADPENRGLAVFYDDSAKQPCLTNKNYYANNGCDMYLNSTHCTDTNLTDGSVCSYYIYDNTTYKPGSNTSENAATYAKYFQCDSDLTIYEGNPTNNYDSGSGMTGSVKVGNKVIALWAHGNVKGSCDDTTSSATDAYMKDLLKYVKANVSAL